MGHDPAANAKRLNTHQRSCPGSVDDRHAENTGPPCGVEAEYGSWGDANAVWREHAEAERAGRRTEPVNDPILVAVSKREIARILRPNIVAVVIADPHRGCRNAPIEDNHYGRDGARNRWARPMVRKRRS